MASGITAVIAMVPQATVTLTSNFLTLSSLLASRVVMGAPATINADGTPTKRGIQAAVVRVVVTTGAPALIKIVSHVSVVYERHVSGFSTSSIGPSHSLRAVFRVVVVVVSTGTTIFTVAVGIDSAPGDLESAD